MGAAQPSELACLPLEPQSHNEAQDLLLFQDYVCKLSHTQRTLEDTYALLQQTELLAGVINEQDCRAIRTACCCLKSLRIRVEARANVTERAVISRQLQLMQASVQHYPTEDLNTADTSCPSRTSAEHFDDRPGPCPENKRSHISSLVTMPRQSLNGTVRTGESGSCTYCSHALTAPMPWHKPTMYLLSLASRTFVSPFCSFCRLGRPSIYHCLR